MQDTDMEKERITASSRRQSMSQASPWQAQEMLLLMVATLGVLCPYWQVHYHHSVSL